MNNDLIILEDLVNNPTARVPICLCLDISGSMHGTPIEELNEGVKLFYDSLKEDETAFYSAEISIVTFGKSVEPVADFTSLERQTTYPKFYANGMTPMGEAINLALDLLEKRKQEYKDKGVDYYQPWLVIMTDGKPNGNPTELINAINRTNELINEKKLTLFPIGIGVDADMDTLAKLSPKRKPLKLRELRFKEFFAWLSQSVSKTSQSMPGERIDLDIESILDKSTGWGEL